MTPRRRQEYDGNRHIAVDFYCKVCHRTDDERRLARFIQNTKSGLDPEPQQEAWKEGGTTVTALWSYSKNGTHKAKLECQTCWHRPVVTAPQIRRALAAVERDTLGRGVLRLYV